MDIGSISNTNIRIMTFISLFVLWLVEDIGQSTLAAVLTVEVSGHEDSGTTLLSRALAPQTVDLAIVINLGKM